MSAALVGECRKDIMLKAEMHLMEYCFMESGYQFPYLYQIIVISL